MIFKKWRNTSIAILMIIFILRLFSSEAAQLDLVTGKYQASEKTLHINADKLVYDRNSLYIIFTGNTRATFGDMTLTSDELKIRYLDDQADQTQLNENKIDEIIATGHVVFKFDNKTAYCDRAVYNSVLKTIELTGEDARIESEKNYINGEKIVVEQLTGRIIVDGGPEKRVNAFFTPKEGSSGFIEDKKE